MKRIYTCCLLAIVTLLLVASDMSAYEGSGFHNKGVPKLNYDSLFNEAVTVGESPEAQRFIEECIEVYGGKEHLGKLTSLTLRYRTELPFSSDTAEVTKSWTSGRRLSVIQAGVDPFRRSVLNGDQAWRVTGDSVTAEQDAAYNGQLFGYLTHQMPLAIVTEPFTAIKFGRREADSLVYVYMKKDDSVMIVIGISPDDKLIRLSEGVTYTETGTLVYMNRFGEHKEVDGYWLPHRVINISLGLEVGRSHLESVEINPELKDDLFFPDDSRRRLE